MVEWAVRPINIMQYFIDGRILYIYTPEGSDFAKRINRNGARTEKGLYVSMLPTSDLNL